MQEGLEMLLPHLDGSRVINVPGAFFEKIVAKKDKQFTFDEIAATFSENLATKFKSMLKGSAIIQFTLNVNQLDLSSVCIWIGRNSVLLMIGKEEIKGFMRHSTTVIE